MSPSDHPFRFFAILAAFFLPALSASGQESPARIRIEGLPEGLPASLRAAVEIAGRRRVLLLERASPRAPSFRLLVQGAGGGLTETVPPPSRTYRGSVEGEPEVIVSASLLPQGLRARLIPRDGPGWTISPLRGDEPGADRAWHLVAEDPEEEALGCASETLRIDDSGSEPLPIPGGRGGAVEETCTLKVADLAFDSDYEFFSRKADSNTDTCMDII